MFSRSIAVLACIAGVYVLGLEVSAAEDLRTFLPTPGTYDVCILRDTWGIPHIFGKRDADAAYGLGFVQSEDDWVNMEDAILAARGQWSSVRRYAFAKFDYLFHLFRVREFVDAQYETELSPEFRAVIEAYADGITHFAALHREKMPHLALPVTGRDIVAGAVFKSPFFYDLQEDLEQLFNTNRTVPISRKGLIGSLSPGRDPLVPGGAAGDLDRRMLGSNAWAVGPARSADGATRLAINSHMPWSGPVAFYEAHVHSDEGWDMTGSTFPAGGMIFMGHDENKGWCHTISRPDLADIYVLEMNPANPNQYKFDGVWRDLERAEIPVRVRLWGRITWTFHREALWSVHGPAVRRPDGVYAIRFAGYGEVRQLEQWYRMNKARNVDEFRDALRMLALPSLNTLYADKNGNLFYAYTGRFPVRAEGYDWAKCVPGNTSATLWTEVYPFDALPQVLNPPSAFIQSCNSTPFHTTVGEGNPRPADFPASMGIETHLTNRSRRALELYGGDASITRDEFYSYKYDKTYADDAKIVQFLDKLFAHGVPDEAPLPEALELLKSWDRTTTKDNPAAALAVLVGEPHSRRQEWGGVPFNPVNVLREAVKVLLENHGRLNVPWQEMMRLRRGTLDLGLGGGPDCLRAVDPELDEDGRFRGINGDCYVLLVEWDRDGLVRSQAVHQFGSAAAAEHSPHFADQAPLFAAEQMRPTWLTETDIREHLKREYRPGEIGDPWYAQ